MDRRLAEMTYDTGLRLHDGPTAEAIDRWWGEPNEPLDAANADVTRLVARTVADMRQLLAKYDHDLTPQDAGGIADGINDAAHAMLSRLEEGS